MAMMTRTKKGRVKEAEKSEIEEESAMEGI